MSFVTKLSQNLGETQVFISRERLKKLGLTILWNTLQLLKNELDLNGHEKMSSR